MGRGFYPARGIFRRMSDGPPADRRPAAGTPEDPVLGAGVILWRRGPRGPEFLLLRNARHGTWGFAKGHLDVADADPQAGALREVREETGIELDAAALAPDFLDVSSYRPKKRWKRVLLYLAEVAPGTDLARSDEHDKAGWFPEAEALARLEHDELRRSLIRAARRAG
jgi:8-oxo-dGTP pyrophosphatase MutT (NUDIX family)